MLLLENWGSAASLLRVASQGDRAVEIVIDVVIGGVFVVSCILAHVGSVGLESLEHTAGYLSSDRDYDFVRCLVAVVPVNAPGSIEIGGND